MIGSRIINPVSPNKALPRPLIIAEAGVNHEGSLEIAKRLVREAAEGGADAIKFQTYRADTLVSIDSPAYWDTSQEPTLTQYALYKKHDSFWKREFEELKKCCDVHSIEFMSTPFDSSSAEFLNDLVEVFKISSSDITNRPFIEEIARYGKPIILSTGASQLDEIDDALAWIDAEKTPAALMHCVLSYPTLDKHANLGMIIGLKKRYPERLIGYSDHTLPGEMENLKVATLLGAEVLEKHFTHDKTIRGNDHYHAMDLGDLKRFSDKLEGLYQLIGQTEKIPLEVESAARLHARRSVVAVRDLTPGMEIGLKDITWKRPGNGISPRDYGRIIGKRVKVMIKKDEIIKWESFE